MINMRNFSLPCTGFVLLSSLGAVGEMHLSTGVGFNTSPYYYPSSGTVVYVHDHHEPKPEPYSREWLYHVARDNPNFMLFKEVRENRDYFIQLIRDHIQKLEYKLIDQRSRVSFNKLFHGIMSGVMGGVFIGKASYGLMTKMLKKWYKKDFGGALFNGAGAGIFCCTGALLCFIGCKHIMRAMQYKQEVQKRLERDQGILQQLERMQ